tara:strand:+ start:1507 stop:2835 length:1329 start_codon:yes stop_codon:yes gene_type:complete
MNKKLISYTYYSVFLLVTNYVIFNYVKLKSFTIENFIDEYISLSSNVNFYRNFDFNAGDFIGGPYSIYLTSGPLSAVGGVLGWSIFESFTFSRISNFYWILLLQIIFSYFILKIYKLDIQVLTLLNFVIILLIPWWQGSLYSLGEIASMIIFTNSIFLFEKYRKQSIFLMSMSIFFGKLLTLLPFIGFYLYVLFKEKKLKRVIFDALIFSIPIFFWIMLVALNYEKGNISYYLSSQLDLILNHQSSGASLENSNSFIKKLQMSEYSSWNIFDRFRILLTPVLLIFYVAKNNKIINDNLGKYTVGIIPSIFLPYIWFWLFSPTKWMRYSQHFMVIILIFLIYFLSLNLDYSRINFLFSILFISIFIENNKILIIFTVFLSVYLIYVLKEVEQKTLKILLCIVLVFDISISFFQNEILGEIFYQIESCAESLVSSECRTTFIGD